MKTQPVYNTYAPNKTKEEKENEYNALKNGGGMVLTSKYTFTIWTLESNLINTF